MRVEGWRHSPPVEGVDAAIPLRTEEERSRISCQDLTEELTAERQEKLHGGLASAVEGRELCARKKFKESKTV